GRRPVGWYTGRVSENTRRLVVEEGGFLYDSDSYADELPYWLEVAGRDHLVIPYVLDANDFKFLLPNGFVTGGDFLEYLVDTFEQLHEDGGRMMSVGLHCRIVGRPGRPTMRQWRPTDIILPPASWSCSNVSTRYSRKSPPVRNPFGSRNVKSFASST